MSWYDSLESPHTQLHEAGENLLIAAKEGAPQSELVHLMQKLTSKSIIIIQKLQEIENELITHKSLLQNSVIK